MSYKRFDQEDVVVSAESITSPVWTGDKTTLNTFFTSSTQTGGTTGDYYYNIYNTGSSIAGSRVQFAVAYGDKKGSGSLAFNNNVPGYSPSSTIYGQYRNLVLGDEDSDFTFGNKTSEYFYALSVDRAQYKEKLLPGTLDLVLGISGSGARLRLTDDSQANDTIRFNDAGRVYELVSGSAGNVYDAVNQNGYTNASGSYGKFLPDVGVILLNGAALDIQTGSAGGIGLGDRKSVV